MYILKKYKILFSIMFIINTIMITLCFIPSGYSVVAVGDTSDVGNLIEVETDNESSGSMNSIWVSDFNDATLIQYLFAKMTSNNQINKITPSTSTDYTPSYSDGKISHEFGIEQAIITAYSYASAYDDVSLSYSFEGLIIYYIRGYDSQVELSDIITAYNGIDASSMTPEDFYYNIFSQESLSNITVLRDGEEISIDINSGRNYSFAIYPKYSINYNDSNPKIKINNSLTEGPSAGFMNTLSTFNSLTSFDYTRGLKIAGTGTMNFQGKIGGIGGISQKVEAAFLNNCDIFFCPEANYLEGYDQYLSIKNHERMAFVEVAYFSDAVTYLENV